MKRFVALGFVAFISSISFLGPATLAQESGKKATGHDLAKEEKKANKKVDTKDDRFPDGRKHDFGQVARGTECSHSFRIVNTSNRPIKIAEIRKGMNPLRFFVNDWDLPPKAVGRVEVVVETSRFSGPKTMAFWLTTQNGLGVVDTFTFLVTADSNERLQREVELQLRLKEAACKGFDSRRDGYPPYPGGWTVDSGKSPDIVTVLKQGADVNMPDGKGYTALMYAANLGLLENVKTLLANGADATLKSTDGSTAVSIAEWEDTRWRFRLAERREVVKVLREHLAKKR
jgi:hypothetical protein